MISLICMDQLWIYTCHLRFFTLHCYTSWLPWFWIIMDYLTYYGTWMLKDSSWQAEFSTTGGAAGLGTPPGTQCVLFPVPASLCWFFLQIIDNGVYDATYTIRNNTTIPLYTTNIIQFLSPWISPCPASSVWPLTPGRLDARVRRRFRRRGRGRRRARRWQGRPRTPDHGTTGGRSKQGRDLPQKWGLNHQEWWCWNNI